MANVTIRSTHTPSGKFDDLTTTVIATPQPGDFFDNEPAGYTQLVSLNGSSLTFPGFTNPSGWVNVPSRISVVVDATSKHGQVVKKRFLVGDESGWHGVNIYPTTALYREVYTRLVFRLSPNWQFHKAGEKLLVNRRDIGGVRAIGPDFHMQFNKFHIVAGVKLAGKPSAGPTASCFPIIPGSPTFAGGLPPFQGPFPNATRGVYHTLEQIRRMNSAPGVADGSMRQWINGVEYTRFYAHGGGPDYTDFTMDAIEWMNPVGGSTPPPGISPSVQVLLFWGGQGDTKVVNDDISLSELHISARN